MEKYYQNDNMSSQDDQSTMPGKVERLTEHVKENFQGINRMMINTN